MPRKYNPSFSYRPVNAARSAAEAKPSPILLLLTNIFPAGRMFLKLLSQPTRIQQCFAFLPTGLVMGLPPPEPLQIPNSPARHAPPSSR